MTDNKPPVSVFTITNNPKWLAESWESLKAQTFGEFEWIILPNGGIKRDDIPESAGWLKDNRVFVAPEELAGDIQPGNIGALKAQSCAVAHGEIMLELDHDDLLMPMALERIKEAFDQNPDVGMVYGNCARVNDDGETDERPAYWTPNMFGDLFGWEYRPVQVFGREVLETVSPPPLPQNLSRIFYAPDHPRAFRASEYHRIGRHNPTLSVGDDHELTLRFYLESKILHIDECLYVYRIHGANNWLERNGDIQEQQWRNYESYKLRLADRWCDENDLLKIDLTSVDFDIDAMWPLENGSVGRVRAFDVLQGCRNPIHFFNEAHRVLAHGGWLFALVPSTDGRGAWQDFTHRSHYNENSFWYVTKKAYRDFNPSLRCQFQILRLQTFFPSDWHRENLISYVQADLLCLKDGPRFHGAVEI